MSSIRRPQQNLPGNQNFANGPGGQQFPGQSQGGGGNHQKTFYAAILGQTLIDAQLRIQQGIAQSLSVPQGVQPMSAKEVLVLDGVVKGLHMLAKAKQKCGSGGWSRHQQQGDQMANQTAGAFGEAWLQNDEAFQPQENANANAGRQPAYAGTGR